MASTTPMPQHARGGWFVTVFALVLGLIGLVLAAMGSQLVALGGSWYYVVAGVLLVVAGVQLWRRRASAFWVLGLTVGRYGAGACRLVTYRRAGQAEGVNNRLKLTKRPLARVLSHSHPKN